MTNDFTEERRKAVYSWYNDPRWVEYCGRGCGQRLAECRCVTGAEETAPDVWGPLPPFDGTTERDATPTVSLPTEPDTHEPVLEETQPSLSDWCDVCGFARAYCRGHSS